MSKSTGDAAARQDGPTELTHEQAAFFLNTSAENYFLFRRDLLRLGLALDEAVVLQHLVNVQYMVGGEWFECTVDQLQESLLISDKVQLRILRSLTEKGWIKTDLRGIPPRRQVWIDMPKIVAGLMGFQRTPKRASLNTPKRGSSIDTSNKTSSLRSLVCRAKGQSSDFAASSVEPLIGDNTTTTSPLFADWAHRLHTIAVTVHRQARRWRERDWADQFRLLLADCDGDEARVEAALAWYEQHAADTALIAPIKSAEAFRARFFKDLEEKVLGKHWTQTRPGKAQAVAVTDEAQNLADRLREDRDWLRGSAAELPATVQLSLTYATALCRTLAVITDAISPQGGPRVVGGPIALLEAFYAMSKKYKPVHVVSMYMKRVYTDLHGWKKWKGNLTTFALDDDRFAKWLGEIADDELGPVRGPKALKKLMEMIHESRK